MLRERYILLGGNYLDILERFLDRIQKWTAGSGTNKKGKNH